MTSTLFMALKKAQNCVFLAKYRCFRPKEGDISGSCVM